MILKRVQGRGKVKGLLKISSPNARGQRFGFKVTKPLEGMYIELFHVTEQFPHQLLGSLASNAVYIAPH